MSTLLVDDVAGRLGGTASNLPDGIAKARAYYDQVTPGVTNSVNVTSVSDDSTGVYTVNFTNGFSGTDYFRHALLGIGPGGFAGTREAQSSDLNAASASSCEAFAGGGGAVADFSHNFTEFAGDLA